jgi:hypothetical protein
LNDTAPANRRPSSSGSITVMARSVGERPRVAVCQSASLDAANATCSTGQSAASSAVLPSLVCAEKAVALTITAGCSRAMR